MTKAHLSPFHQENYRRFDIVASPGNGFIISRQGFRYGSSATLEGARHEVDQFVALGLGD